MNVKKWKEHAAKIVTNINPMRDTYHVGIRSAADVMTLEEAINSDDPGYWMEENAESIADQEKSGLIRVYSSKAMNRGNFVATEQIQAQEYAGGRGSYVNTAIVSIWSIAWINASEGQIIDEPESVDRIRSDIVG